MRDFRFLHFLLPHIICLCFILLSPAAAQQHPASPTQDLDPSSPSLKPPKPTKIVGIGVVLSTKPGHRGEVARVVKGGPAEAIGIEPGVIIRKINGRTVKKMNSKQIAKMLRGKRGKPVKLTIWYPTIDSEATYTLRRTELPVPMEWTSPDVMNRLY